MRARYWQYWGKAKPANANGAAWHLLPLHALDVAAVMQCLLEQEPDWLSGQARQLGWQPDSLRQHLVLFAALHDLGKFSCTFQRLFAHDSPDLVACANAPAYRLRHDSLGYLLWDAFLSKALPEAWLPQPGLALWDEWMRVVCGHHGEPPLEDSPSLGNLFFAEDKAAAQAFCEAMFALLLPQGLQAPAGKAPPASKTFSWPFAGLMVLADWLGSCQNFFPYHATPPDSLQAYWVQAQARAQRAVCHAGLAPAAVAPYAGAGRLTDFIPYLSHPTPLQRFAANVALADGPQLFLLEDVTGAGKTEAALILAHRLMAAGRAGGLYFALPTMATSNQMYRRVGGCYRKLYAPGATPSIVLAHSARRLVGEFAQSLHQPDRAYAATDATATMRCNTWLADGNKKALLANVGVGSIDQALLAVLPARHQSLRIAGLRQKVLIVDEVHAYDPYVLRLLCALLRTHAAQGGSAILLSATVPHAVKQPLLSAYQQGLGLSAANLEPVADYPLVTHCAAGLLRSFPCETRDEVKRTVAVRHLHDEQQVIGLVAEQAAAGRSVCWIRNTVDDARQAFVQLQKEVATDKLHLFHSRYAMGDRLDIETRVLDRLGKQGSAEDRHGLVLIGSQVLEQSLDFDVDVMISDLAPIDLLIQRAGRLQRHARAANGEMSQDGKEYRLPPVLYVYGPPPEAEPDANWYGSVFRKGKHVYSDSARLWLTQQVLLQAGAIVSPGEPGQPGAVRQLVEAVYGDEALALAPGSLLPAAEKVEGEAMGKVGMANYNTLQFGKGYCQGSSKFWDEDANIPTRLADETRTVYLAIVDEAGALQPWYQDADQHLQWAMSALRVRSQQLHALSDGWATSHAAALQTLRDGHAWLHEQDLALPMRPTSDGIWTAEACRADGRPVLVRYSLAAGLEMESAR